MFKKRLRRIHCSYLERHLHSIQTTQVTNLVDHYTTPSQLIPWKPRSPFSLCILKDLFFAQCTLLKDFNVTQSEAYFYYQILPKEQHFNISLSQIATS